MKSEWKFDPRTGMYWQLPVMEASDFTPMSTDPAANAAAAIRYMQDRYTRPGMSVWPGGGYVANAETVPHPLVEAARFGALFVRRHWRALVRRRRG